MTIGFHKASLSVTVFCHKGISAIFLNNVCRLNVQLTVATATHNAIESLHLFTHFSCYLSGNDVNALCVLLDAHVFTIKA